MGLWVRAPRPAPPWQAGLIAGGRIGGREAEGRPPLGPGEETMVVQAGGSDGEEWTDLKVCWKQTTEGVDVGAGGGAPRTTVGWDVSDQRALWPGQGKDSAGGGLGGACGGGGADCRELGRGL